MIDIRPFAPADLAAIELQPGQLPELGGAIALHPAYGERLWRGGPAFTALDGERVLCCAGVIEVLPHYATAWAFLAAGLGPAMVPITRAVRRFLDAGAWRRIDTTCRADFAEAARWAVMLGFAHEGRMRFAALSGGDNDLYARTC